MNDIYYAQAYYQEIESKIEEQRLNQNNSNRQRKSFVGNNKRQYTI